MFRRNKMRAASQEELLNSALYPHSYSCFMKNISKDDAFCLENAWRSRGGRGGGRIFRKDKARY